MTSVITNYTLVMSSGESNVITQAWMLNMRSILADYVNPLSTHSSQYIHMIHYCLVVQCGNYREGGGV